MIIYTPINLFNSPAQTIVNTVNLHGIMGKGIAKDFKKYYPRMFRKYKKICQNKKLDIGKLLLSKEEPVISRGTKTSKIRNRWVLNFPTKQHWREKSKLEYIEAGLDKFVSTYKQKQIVSVSFPQLGVGNGGLKWDDVKQLMEKYLKTIDIPVYIHIYNNGDKYSVYDSEKINKNLNRPFDYWKENASDLINVDILKFVNIDGVVYPMASDKLINELKEFYITESFPILIKNDVVSTIRLIEPRNVLKKCKDIDIKQESNEYEQLSLF